MAATGWQGAPSERNQDHNIMSFNPNAEEAINLLEGFFYWNGFPKLLGCEIEKDFSQADIALAGLPLAINPIERTQYLAPRAVRHRSQAYHTAVTVSLG